MNRKILLWAMALVVIIPALIGTGYYIYWDQFQRWAPVTITRNQAEIQALLDKVDYVSPGRNGPPIYFITYRSCAQCRAFEEQEFPKYDAAGIDTRVIVYALPDNQGLHRSSAVERSTIAELWISRKWEIYQAWFSSSDANWRATGLPVADNDFARDAVVQASRNFLTQLQPYLAANNVRVSYPLVIWRDQNNMLKVCSCSDERAFHFIREDLNVSNAAVGSEGPMFHIPDNLLPKMGDDKSSAAASSSSAAPAPAPAPVQAQPAAQAAKPAAAEVKRNYTADFGPDQ
ncbi:hypothetical protein [Asticcacaulis solisilvae]|uniref:hypothetical protein n=1 Tax=Asticcacaulis solisilvae TaxID=1217274 RepID=UPI003FD80D18